MPPTVPVQRPRDAQPARRRWRRPHQPRAAQRAGRAARSAGDLVVANDAATLPASLPASTCATGAAIEVRLAGRRSLARDDVACFLAVVFGAGDFRTPHRGPAAAAAARAGDRSRSGRSRRPSLRVARHPRLVALRFDGARRRDPGRHRASRPAGPVRARRRSRSRSGMCGRAIAGAAGRVRAAIGRLRRSTGACSHRCAQRGIGFATLTHAAGLSSTGDAALDARLPFDEPYHMPAATVAAIAAARERGGRVIAIGTTVVARARARRRATGRVRAGRRARDQPARRDRRARASSTRSSAARTSPGRATTSCCARSPTTRRSTGSMRRSNRLDGYRTHEFGDSVLVERGVAPPRAYAEPRSNLKTATLASRLGSVRTTLPA